MTASGVDPRVARSPELHFSVEDAAVLEFAAVPTLRFGVRIGSDRPVRSLTLQLQLYIRAAGRSYSATERQRLSELLGSPQQWAGSGRSLFWTQATLQVPGFEGSTLVQLPVACTYDFDFAMAKYFHGLEHGEVPLTFLFSGISYYEVGGRLQVGRVDPASEAPFRLPVRTWRLLMEHYFPGTAWLRVRADVFDNLNAYRIHRGLTSWDDAIEALLREHAPGPLSRRAAGECTR